MMGAYPFPPWHVMIATDVLLILVALCASAVVILRRRDLKQSGAIVGVSFILGGLWLIAAYYLADLYTMTVMPMTYDMDTAMAAMASLHYDYNWYVFAMASVLVLAGLMVTVYQFTHQVREIRERSADLRESESVLDSIFENLPVGLLIKDDDHVVERANSTYVKWYGNEIIELLGNRSEIIEGFLTPDDTNAMHTQEVEVLKTGKVMSRQIARPFLDGKMHTIRIIKFPIYSSNGQITKVGSVSVDLTEQVRAEEAAKDALYEAEEANRAKSQFIATMSHEFRTPLNAILGFSEMLRGEYFGPLGAENYHSYADDIHNSGVHLLGLVNDILDVAAIEAGKRTLHKEKFDIVDVLKDCIRNVDQSAEERGIELLLDVPDGLGPVNADRKAVSQIFLNIIANAVKFTKERGTVGVSARIDGAFLEVCVSDTGVGISDALLPSITEPFAKGQSNPHVTESGTGLGLSIVKSLVDAHDGELTISSVSGVGTAVYVRLPL